MITLISPRLAIQKGDFLGSGVPYWPIELAIFSSFLKEKNIPVGLIDMFGDGVRTVCDAGDHYLQGQSIDAYFSDKRLVEASCFIVYAISSMSHGETLNLIEHLKSQYGKPICVLENSQAVTAYAIDERKQEFFNRGADALLCGEPYWNWEEVHKFIYDGFEGTPPQNMVSKNQIPSAPVVRLMEKNPRTAFPSWGLINTANYWSLPYSHGPKTKTFFPILTSRGCPYPCDFCVVPSTNSLRWRGRSADDVVSEMLFFKEKYGVIDFQVEDLNPTVSKDRTRALCELLIQKGAGIRFYLVSGTKAETIPLDQVALLAKAGCRYISISPESGSKEIMKAIGKPFDYEHGQKLVTLCREYGIFTQACFVVGHPNETPEDHSQSISYLKRLIRSGLDEAAFFILSPLPGSKLEKNGRMEMEDKERLLSFSPKGRFDFNTFDNRRKELIRSFFIWKMVFQPWSLLKQTARSLLGTPRTKMENLPRRILFVKKLLRSIKCAV